MSYWGYEDDSTTTLPPIREHVRSHRAVRSHQGVRSHRGRRPSVPAPPPPPDTALRKGIRGVGEVLITCGLIVMLFAGYEVWGKQVIIQHQQTRYDQQLAQAWKKPTSKHKADDAPPLPGHALARLYIPRFNKKLVVVQGVQPSDIANAPGHYPDSAMPGQIGNFAIAGHREEAIFPRNFNELTAGNYLVVQTRTTWFVYQVYQQEIVLPTQTDVVNPVPDKPAGTVPSKALITLTTCNPWWDNYQRLIIHGTLIRAQPTTGGKPSELEGM